METWLWIIGGFILLFLWSIEHELKSINGRIPSTDYFKQLMDIEDKLQNINEKLENIESNTENIESNKGKY